MLDDIEVASPPLPPRVIKSKLAVPPLPERFAERPRLEKLLANLIKEKRAVVVTAAAGSGKTTAVAGAVRKVRRPVVWLTVDRPDAAPGRLVTYLEAAIAQQVPAAAGVATGAIAAGVAHAEAAGLLAEAMGPRPAAIVLDELERLGEEPEAWGIIESLLRYMPLGGCAVLVSRRDIPTSLCALPAPPALGAVEDADVAFTTEEAERALSRLGNVGFDAEAVVASTAGWVTGVLFEGWRSVEHLASQGGETDPLYEYLASQILGGLDPQAREFLVETSVLDEVSASRAEALGIAEAGEALGALRSVHLPVVWDAGGRVMRAHSFFREYLMTCLDRRGEEPARAVRVAHGRLLAAEGHPEEAVEVLLRAGALEEALAPAELAIEAVVERMDLAVAERWIAALAGIERAEPSPLTTAELMLAIARDDITRGVQIADRLAAGGQRERLAEFSERAALLMSWCYLHHARYDDVDELLAIAPPGPGVDTLRYAMSALTDRSGTGRPAAPGPPGGPLNAMLCIGDYCHGRLGSLTEAATSSWIEAVERPWRVAALRARGRTKEALEQYELGSRGPHASATMVMLSAPQLLMDAGRWEDAARVIEEGRTLATEGGSHAFMGLSRVYEAELALRHRRDTQAARAALERPECLRGRAGFRYVAELAETWDGLAALLEGRDEEALAELRTAVDTMVAADRILWLPIAATFLSEALWRAGDPDAADDAAQLAPDAAGRQGSSHLLLLALSFFPAVAMRRIDAEPSADSAWHELGRALLAQGVRIDIPVATPVRLQEFGRRALFVDGEEVKPRIAKSYELLSYILGRAGGAADRDELMDALFDGRRDDSKRAYLRQAIRWLRETLPEGAFAAEGQSVRVGDDVAVVSDSVELEQLLAEAARLQGAERLDATLKAIAIADEGPYLPGSRGEWADERDHELADRIAEARYQAAVLAFGEGRLDECRTLVRAVLRHEPFREAAWRLAMRVADALGDQEGAVRAYMECEKALAELGAKPSSSTRLLLERVRG